MSPFLQSPSQLSWERRCSMYSCTEFSLTLKINILITDLDGVRVERFLKYMQAHLEIINCCNVALTSELHWLGQAHFAKDVLLTLPPTSRYIWNTASAPHLCLENASVERRGLLQGLPFVDRPGAGALWVLRYCHGDVRGSHACGGLE